MAVIAVLVNYSQVYIQWSLNNIRNLNLE